MTERIAKLELDESSLIDELRREFGKEPSEGTVRVRMLDREAQHIFKRDEDEFLRAVIMAEFSIAKIEEWFGFQLRRPWEEIKTRAGEHPFKNVAVLIDAILRTGSQR
jgi:hypothetical protein